VYKLQIYTQINLKKSTIIPYLQVQKICIYISPKLINHDKSHLTKVFKHVCVSLCVCVCVCVYIYIETILGLSND